MKNLTTIFNFFLFPFSFLINNLKKISILNFNIRKILLVFISIFISTSTYAVELANDTFDNSSLDGWSGTGVTSNNGSMEIDRDRTASKTYDFGASYANQTLTIEFNAEVPNDWEDSGGALDYFYVLINGSVAQTYYSDGGTINQTFTANANSSGSITLGFNPDTTADNENATIDWITINGTPITPIGCDNSLDTSANSTSPYTIVTDMHNITSSTSKCISGSTSQADGSPEKEDNYYFTVGTDGTLDVTTLSPNGNPYHLRIGTSAGDTTYYGDTTAEVHNVSTINLTAGDTVYFYFKETGNDEDHYQITFDFVAANTPPPNICTGTPGLNGTYYNTNDFTGAIQMSRIDSDINFEWGYGNPGGGVNDNDFSITWTGTIYFPEDADYIFSLAHDDVMTVIIGGTTIYNNSSWTGGSNNFNDTSPIHFDAGTYPITISFVEWGGGAYTKFAWRNNGSIGSQTIVPSTNLCAQTPSDTLEAVNDYFSTPANTSLIANVFTNDLGTGYSIIAADASSLAGIVTSYDANTGAFTFEPALDFTGTTSFTYTISDDGGTTTSTATVQIEVTPTALIANDDSYDTNPGVSVRGNLLANDSGIGLEYTSMTSSPSLGSVTIQGTGDFTYTPTSGVSGTDTFTYLITDDFGQTAEANVTITIGTDFTTGATRPFELINPDYSRNVIGDYKIAGNTVLCLTEQTSGYGGSCTNDQWNTSNNYVSKYLDIDNDGGTWNSTSSYINFDAPYEPTRGIIWAGLFWGGRISTDDTYSIRYAVENGSNAFSTIEVGEGTNVNSIDIETTGATNIKLKIDNGDYTDVLSSTFHISPSSGGETYAAYADVSAVLQSANLATGKHVFTVANLTTMEGREGSPGAFGGWSLVVIYGEGYEFGKPRNISIYNGFIDIGTNNDPIEISGFKLPETGDVSAQLSVFSGEGEYLYGRNTNSNNEDWMKISDQENSGYDYMPGLSTGTELGNQNNMFDATLDGILRDSITGEFNDLSNNNVGVDIDNYDVSDLMTAYRANDADLDSVYIQMYSNNDYITPSMMAFSAELYVPELCYDYTLDIDGYVLPSVNNEIITPFGGFGQPLTTVLYLKSLEGDIDLSNVNANYYIRDTAQLTYNDCTTEISETGEFDYSDACLYTHDATSAGFGMYIGSGKTSASGGIISAFEDRYIKFDSDFHISNVNTGFEFSVNYTVDYGSGAVPLTKIFTPADLCAPSSEGFLPEMGYFNVTDITNDIDEWNLYTQVTRRPFNLKLYAYEFDAGEYLNPIGYDLNLSVEVEVIRADNFNRDANTACNDEHSAMTDVDPRFVNFNDDGDGRSVEFGYDADDVNFAYRSAAMRVWYLSDVDGNGTLLDNHNCTRVNQTECIDLYDSQYNGDNSCTNECRVIASSGNCYDCLRSHYGRKVCSRDNFAIRPESFITQVYDSNQSADTTMTSNHIANSTTAEADNEFALVSGYQYRFDINATNHVGNIATPRYIQHFEPGSPTHHVRMNWYPDASHPNTALACNDVEDKNITLNIFNGSTINPVTHLSYTDEVDQIGQYRFEVYDQNWTSADWNADEMLHHQAGSPYANYYKTGADCIQNDDIVYEANVNDKQGCVISSVHLNRNTDVEYKYLYAQYYPYAFDVTGLSFGARPSYDGDTDAFVYINTLDPALYPNGVDENMSYNIKNTFTAVGRTGNRVSNFVENCYADNVDMSLYQKYNHTEPATEPYLSYYLVDFNTTGTIYTDSGRFDGVSNISTSDPLVPLVILQSDNVFKKDMNGSLRMDVGYNYNRTMNTTLNPRHVNMRDFNLTYTAPPPDIFVDLKTDHEIYGNINIDRNISFLYGKVKPALTYYETANSNIDTPVSTVVYCDLGFTECQNRGIMAFLGQTNEATWWKSWDHTTPQDGTIELVSTPTSALNRTSAVITSEGEDPTINVNNGGVAPLLVPVNLVVVADPTSPPANYTDRWLLYNEFSATTPPIPFYRVKFLGASGWVGKGDTGHVVGDDVNTKNNRRLEW